ncbi:MAG: ATP-binding cassette domain-containing protein [Deltaproteobacteria bacterium]|nr:ATP-binding cassette domain-containing protein [Deltaproteobacteria bacterium]
MDTLLEVRNLRKAFSVTSGPLEGKKLRLQAVDGLSFTLAKGETLGVVGESGCGKSTAAKLLMRLFDADEGEALYQGVDLLKLSRRQLRPYRRKIQMVFQDPFSSLNPRMRVGNIIGEALIIHKLAPAGKIRSKVVDLLGTVGLSEEYYDRFPHEFSGGQRQRIGIARALAVQPELIIADEPVSALDVSIQAQIVNLLQDIQDEFGLTYIFISHDLSVIEHISDRVAVMYLGKIVETASSGDLYGRPHHPYTEALLNALPVPRPGATKNRRILTGEVPSPLAPPSGCHFHPRCPYVRDICRTESPLLEEKAAGHLAACHFSREVGRHRASLAKESRKT